MGGTWQGSTTDGSRAFSGGDCSFAGLPPERPDDEEIRMKKTPKKTPMTLAGMRKLRAELDRLKNEDRPRLVQAIAEARAHGDLKENAEYHAAREQQGFVEGRIRAIEGKLSNAQLIDVSKIGADGKVVFGATVTLLREETGEEITYRIVGEDESDVTEGLLSYASPMARAIIGREEGELVEVETPGGKRGYEIVSVKYI